MREEGSGKTEGGRGVPRRVQKLAIVTGANSGVGLETARGLLARGFRVVLAVRDVAKGEAAARTIGGGEVMRLDVADLASARAFAKELLARHERLDVLVNNAGIHSARQEVTPQGHGSTFATNHLGHFLLTKLLLDLLKRSAPSRVINVASEAHRYARMDLDRLDEAGIVGYNRSKLANVMFTYALARRLEGTGVSVFAVHPGIVRTGWARGRGSGIFRFGTALASPFMSSPEKGARTSLYAATSPDLDGRTGLYLVRERVARSSAASRDVAMQERLWTLSEELTKE